MTDTMKAYALIRKPAVGSVPEEIKEITLPMPRIGKNDVLVKIHASTMHVDDIAMAQGTALGRFLGPKTVTLEKPYVMGSNFSGVVTAKGEKVSEFSEGDEVMGIPQATGENGAWAEYRAIDKKHLRLKPKEMSHEIAAATVVAGCVAYGMIRLSGVKEKEKCLVLGASGGIGSMVVQMLKARGADVTALCSARNKPAVSALGADRIINYQEEDFKEIIAGEGSGMDLVFDSVGGLELERDSLAILKRSGRFLTVCGPQKYIGSRLLSRLEVFRIIRHILYLSVSSRFNGPRYLFSEIPPGKTIDEMLRMVIDEDITIPVDRVIPFRLEQIKEGLKDLANHKATGRIVLQIEGGEET